jgi:hypothetical protein
MNQAMEITVDIDTNTLNVQRLLLRIPGVLSCNTKSNQTIQIAYDDSQIAAKRIVKLAGYERGMRRRNNVISVREIVLNPSNT